MTEYKNAVEIADTYMRAMTEGDYNAVIALYADDAILEDPVGSPVLAGKAAISAFYKSIEGTKLSLQRTGPVRLAGNEMVFPFQCITENNGSSIQIDIIDNFVLNDENLIISMRAFWGPANTSVAE